MGPPKKLPCEAGSFCCYHNLHRFFQSEVLKLYFPTLSSLSSSLAVPPSCLYACTCGTTHSASFHLALSASHHLVHQVLQPSSCSESSLPRLPVLSPPTDLDECFFFNSLVVRLPYSSVFWQLWLFFVFKFVVVLLFVVQGGKVYLSTYASILARSPEFSKIHQH